MKILAGLLGVVTGALVFALIFLAFSAEQAKADDKCSPVYTKVGVGYKFVEYKYRDFDYVSPYAARIEIGVECGNLSFGVGHQSQWTTGWPVDKREEPNKTEFFIDYKVYFD